MRKFVEFDVFGQILSVHLLPVNGDFNPAEGGNFIEVPAWAEHVGKMVKEGRLVDEEPLIPVNT